MSLYDSIVSREAWDDLVRQYRDAGGEDASHRALAEIIRQKVSEVEDE